MLTLRRKFNLRRDTHPGLVTVAVIPTSSVCSTRTRPHCKLSKIRGEKSLMYYMPEWMTDGLR